MDYEVIGSYIVHYGDAMECHVVDLESDVLVKSFYGEMSHHDANRWAWDNSLNPHIHG